MQCVSSLTMNDASCDCRPSPDINLGEGLRATSEVIQTTAMYSYIPRASIFGRLVLASSAQLSDASKRKGSMQPWFSVVARW